MTPAADPGSFRDPAGFVFNRGDTLYRQVNKSYAPTLERLEGSGFLRTLQNSRMLVSHERVGIEAASTPDAFAVLRPERLSFISYPYEWSFGQLKDAALLTLELQRRALDAGFILRDASSYNVQFNGGSAIFMDSLSFGVYAEGQPWYAYGQFCEQFLAPLALMATVDVRLAALQRSLPDGIPLDLASSVLGAATYLRPGLLLHLHLHATARRRLANSTAVRRVHTMSLASLRRLTENLRATIEGLKWQPRSSEWSHYETEHRYDAESALAKQTAVRDMMAAARPRTVWDLGANTGTYSFIAAEIANHTVAIDSDHAAVEQLYARIRQKSGSLLPLVMDLRNPSPARGWAHAERKSLAQRGPVDMVLALALVHHLAVRGGIPLATVAAWFADIAHGAIVEFVPPDDPQVLRLLAGRNEETHPYSEAEFLSAFGRCFSLRARRPLPQGGRVLYAFERLATTLG
jgi:hypothetical protein